MKKLVHYFFTLNIFIFLSILPVKAECSYTDKASLNKLASNVKINYEIVSEVVDMSGEPDFAGEGSANIFVDHIDLSAKNISKELYVVELNSETGVEKTIKSEDTVNGIMTTRIDDLTMIRKYSYKVYASSLSSCPGEMLKTTYITLPMYNPHSERQMCKDEPDFYLCKKYITSKNVTEDEFSGKLDNYKKGDTNEEGTIKKESEPWYDGVKNFIFDNKYYIAAALLLLIAGGIGIRRLKTKKQRELGL